MSGLTVLVVDDEPLARRRLIRLLAQTAGIARVEEAADPAAALQLAGRLRPDVLLLDIQMPGGTGFDLLERLPEAPPALIFVTAFDHHALEAFAANAVDYLTKPVEPARFAAAMARARDAVAARSQTDRIAELQEMVAALRRSLVVRPAAGTFWVKQRGEYLRLAPEAILRFQAERDYVRIHVAGADYLYQESLAALERRLDPQLFLRVHRSTILRLGAVQRLRPAPFGGLIAVMSDGAELRIGRTYLQAVRGRLMGG